MNETTSKAQVPVAAANSASDRQEAASRIGSLTMCCFKIRIAARSAMGGTFLPTVPIIGGANCSAITREASSHPILGAQLDMRFGIVFSRPVTAASSTEH